MQRPAENVLGSEDMVFVLTQWAPVQNITGLSVRRLGYGRMKSSSISNSPHGPCQPCVATATEAMLRSVRLIIARKRGSDDFRIIVVLVFGLINRYLRHVRPQTNVSHNSRNVGEI